MLYLTEPVDVNETQMQRLKTRYQQLPMSQLEVAFVAAAALAAICEL